MWAGRQGDDRCGKPPVRTCRPRSSSTRPPSRPWRRRWCALAPEPPPRAPCHPRAGYTPEQRAAGVPCSANQEQMVVLYQMLPGQLGLQHGRRHAPARPAGCRRRWRPRWASWRHRHEIPAHASLWSATGRCCRRCYPGAMTAARCPRLQRHTPDQCTRRRAAAALGRPTWASQPYQLFGAGVPLRTVLIKVGRTTTCSSLAMHHILRCPQTLSSQPAFDAPATCTWTSRIDHMFCCLLTAATVWSMGDTFCGAGCAYNALQYGRPAGPDLPALPIQYPDFSAWQRARLDGGGAGGAACVLAPAAGWRAAAAGAAHGPARPAVPSGRVGLLGEFHAATAPLASATWPEAAQRSASPGSHAQVRARCSWSWLQLGRCMSCVCIVTSAAIAQAA